MESALLTLFILSSFAVDFSPNARSNTEWNDMVVSRVGTFTTLVCTDKTATGAVSINWMVQLPGTEQWKLVFSANEKKEFSGGASKDSMQLTDHNFQDTGVFSLLFRAQMEDRGLYSCLVKQQRQVLKEWFILLVILTVTVSPAGLIPQQSTLLLIASVNPDFAVNKITWVAPGGITMKTEKSPKIGTVAKLPQVKLSDSGAYVCVVQPRGNSSKALFPFNVDVTVSDNEVAKFSNIKYGETIYTAARAQTSIPLTCSGDPGDYVKLYWRPTETHDNMTLVFQYDRWRKLFSPIEQSKTLELAGPPYNPETGSFSFVLTPWVKDGGLYICEVVHNDSAHGQWTMLSVVKVNTRTLTSKLELDCRYSESTQVKEAFWKYQNESHPLHMSSNGPGSITTTVPLPITADTAGNYTCTLQLKSGQTVMATHTLPVEPGLNDSVTTPSLLPSLYALLLLVPLVAVAVSALLWRQKHISDRGIEQSLSVHSREAENIYENPEDIRQAPPQGSVYMDLKPRGEDDVYKELERYEQCQS